METAWVLLKFALFAPISFVVLLPYFYNSIFDGWKGWKKILKQMLTLCGSCAKMERKNSTRSKHSMLTFGLIPYQIALCWWFVGSSTGGSSTWTIAIANSICRRTITLMKIIKIFSNSILTFTSEANGLQLLLVIYI